jgi:uncharacterized repeat protein (TIGR01451 family)
MKKVLFTMVALVLAIGLALPMAMPVAADSAAVWTDEPDYSPEETVTISGSGFNALADVTVTIERPNGIVDMVGASTDEDGSFTCTYQLDGITGTYTVTATDGINTASTTFTDSAWPKCKMDIVSGDPQSVELGDTLAPFVVLLTKQDTSGSPVVPQSGLTVNWAITKKPDNVSGESLSDASTTTGAGGQTSSTLTIGNRIGDYEVTATGPVSPNDYGSVTFTVHVTGPSVANVKSSGLSWPGEVNSFSAGDDVYAYIHATGTGSVTVDIYVVTAGVWGNGADLTTYVAKASDITLNTTTSPTDFGPYLIWSSATAGDYDIIIDYNQNGTLDGGDDRGDDLSSTIGFTVTSSGSPSLTIEKEANVEEALEGETIGYTYSVTNDGDFSLTGLYVTDSLGITVSPVQSDGYNVGDDDPQDGNFDQGEVWEFTAQYTVPWFTAGPVTNTATATATYVVEDDVTDTSDEVSVDILHNPDIEVTKSGPASPNFQTVDPANYSYTVKNTGDCALLVTLEDDVYGVLDPSDGDTYLLPDDPATPEDDPQTWHYSVSDILVCDGYTMSEFFNTATATWEDATGATDYERACWTVIVFQWLPRTIGYWGNWSNHYSPDAMTALVDDVNLNSYYFDGLTPSTVRDILLATNPTGKMTVAKAKTLLVKQLLATWFNVESYNDWVSTEYIATFVGTADTAMDPTATVYLTRVSGAATLFGADTKTVREILTIIESNISSAWNQNQLLTAKDVLDKMNNAENNDYMMFMDPDFEPAACP